MAIDSDGMAAMTRIVTIRMILMVQMLGLYIFINFQKIIQMQLLQLIIVY